MSIMFRQAFAIGLGVCVLLALILPSIAVAHGVSDRDATFVQANKGTAGEFSVQNTTIFDPARC